MAEIIPTFCTVCKEPIPFEREIRKANTCKKDCARQLKASRRKRAEQRKCRICAKPSTPEERKLFQQWRRSLGGDKTRGRGRPRKKETNVEVARAEGESPAQL